MRSNAHLQQAATSELFDQEESAAKDTDEDNRLCELNEAVCRNLHFPSDTSNSKGLDWYACGEHGAYVPTWKILGLR